MPSAGPPRTEAVQVLVVLVVMVTREYPRAVPPPASSFRDPQVWLEPCRRLTGKLIHILWELSCGLHAGNTFLSFPRAWWWQLGVRALGEATLWWEAL